MNPTHQSLISLYSRLGYAQQHTVPLVTDKPEPGKSGLRSFRWLKDARGALVEVHRKSWFGKSHFSDAGTVGQAYISATRPGVVKGWHAHTRQTDRFVCIRGCVEVVTCDLHVLTNPDVTEAPITRTLLNANYQMEQLVIPPGLAHGWRALDTTCDSWILNLCSHEYDGTDEWRREAHSGPWDGAQYAWNYVCDG